MATAFRPLRQLPQKQRKSYYRLPDFAKPRELKYSTPKSLSYARIKQEVMDAIARLPADKQALIPASGTLPEQMIALGLVWLNYSFACQSPTSGGRLRLGGAVVDFVVYLGGVPTICRVMGAFWHSSAERKRMDLIQLERLRSKGYRVFDAPEAEIYLAWSEGRLRTYVEEGINNAA